MWFICGHSCVSSPLAQARDAVLQAIYNLDRSTPVPPHILEADTGRHVEVAATHTTGLVPLALLLLLAKKPPPITTATITTTTLPLPQGSTAAASSAGGGAPALPLLSVADAQAQLAQTPSLRLLLIKLLQPDDTATAAAAAAAAAATTTTSAPLCGV